MTLDTTAAVVWNSFLRRKSPSVQEKLLLGLSPQLRETLDRQPALPLDRLFELKPPEDSLDQIHYSWFSPFLRTLPEKEIKLFISALSTAQAKGLKQTLLLSNLLPSLSSLGKRYLQKTLFQTIAPEDLLPLTCLPPHPLNRLLDLASDELLALIDLLAMHDLSVEIRHIIDTMKLKEIHGLLTRPQLHFLKKLMHKKEPITFKKMGLVAWEKDPEMLHGMLVQRGINRLAKALYPHHRSLSWHVAHRLDIEKGQMLLKLTSPLNHEKAYEILEEQVLELMHGLKEML